MKFVSDHAGYEMMSVISAIRKDSESWAEWRCLRVESAKPFPDSLKAGVHHVLQDYIGEKDGAAFLCDAGELVVFCRGVTIDSLQHLGRNLLDIFAGHELTGTYTVYDIARDWQSLVNIYSYESLVRKKNNAHFNTPRFEGLVQKPSSRTLDNLRVLLVEDDPVTRWLVRRALNGECLLSTAQTVQTAIASYRVCKPDIVFLDLNLPDGNGSEVMADILKEDPGAHVVIFSSHDSMDNIISMIENGARGFITKPFNRDRLMSHLKTRLVTP